MTQILTNRTFAAVVAVALTGSAMSALFVLHPDLGLASHSQCSDGIDNDSDGRIDYPNDNDCQNIDDTNEGVFSGNLFVSLSDDREIVEPGGSVIYRILLQQSQNTEQIVDIDFQVPAQGAVSSPSDGGRIIAGGHIRWDDVTVYATGPKVLTVTVNVNSTTRTGELLVARVVANGITATDATRIEGTTTVTGGFNITISDGQTEVMPGETLQYVVRVKNNRNVAQTTDVRGLIPQFTSLTTASAGHEKLANNTVIWRNQFFAPGDERTYTFTVDVYDRATERYALRATAHAGGTSETDDTYINRGIHDTALRASITDNRDTVERGQLLNYVIEIDNLSHDLGTDEYATASLPIYSEFVDASDGGEYDGQNVRWDHLQIAPSGSRKIAFTIRVRSDAAIGTQMRASVRVQGGFDTDATDVVSRSNERGTPTFGRTTDPGQNLREVSDVLFRKVPSSNEVVPGGFIRYTIYVKNTLSHPISDAIVSDRFDTQYLSFSEGETSVRDNGRLEWRLPMLQPGQEWRTSYVLAVARNAPKDLTLTNVASISGSDVGSLSLTERVRTVRTGVIRDLPQTGAPIATMATWATFFGATMSASGLSLRSRKNYE